MLCIERICNKFAPTVLETETPSNNTYIVCRKYLELVKERLAKHKEEILNVDLYLIVAVRIGFVLSTISLQTYVCSDQTTMR